MRDEESQIAASGAGAGGGGGGSLTDGISVNNKKEGSDNNRILGRGKYKFWALAAVVLLAFWSMFTGSVTLKWSAGNLSRVPDDFEIHKDLDILEVEEKEKQVKHMWDVYTQSRSIRLPTFWQEAFKAAYEDLTSEVPSIRKNALSEIAKMFLVRSTLSHELEPLPDDSSLRR
ncbi:hypothetical protein M9H77_24840 [Catharanthus roseus]|uniref:Uncharacterized protein n=1 Tax=Catharanthus roseus TaxID=4058 RepID=A0ACC0A6G2_CATRO|nr:hypothetical protein M9H77_24840 [Catharanthus roseus]